MKGILIPNKFKKKFYILIKTNTIKRGQDYSISHPSSKAEHIFVHVKAADNG